METMHGWSGFDFAVAGGLLLGATGIYLLLSRLVKSRRQRVVLGIALATALALLWAELAVGVFGTPLAGT